MSRAGYRLGGKHVLLVLGKTLLWKPCHILLFLLYESGLVFNENVLLGK